MMRVGNVVRLAGLLLLFAMLFTVSGCGYKTDPVPPDSIVPRAIEDLRYEIDESGVKLIWSYPVKTIKGTDIVDISSFDVYRAVVPVSDICQSCPIPFGEALEIPGGVTSETGKRRTAEYSSSLLRSGHKYFFKVRSRTSWWADSDDSNIVSFIWHVPTKAPAGLRAKAGDGSVFLSWEPVSTLLDGRAVEGTVTYQVLRSEGGKDFEEIGEPVAEDKLTDSRVVNGQKYFYKVQSLLDFQGNIVRGGVSDVVSEVPEDKTPPKIPAGVAAVQTETGIKVFWEPLKDPQVTGYRIYRRAADQKKAERIGEVLIPYSLFLDENVPTGVRVYYSVSAFDQAEPANESDLSREATIR